MVWGNIVSVYRVYDVFLMGWSPISRGLDKMGGTILPEMVYCAEILILCCVVIIIWCWFKNIAQNSLLVCLWYIISYVIAYKMG